MTFNFLGPGLTVNVEAKVKEQIILDSSEKKHLHTTKELWSFPHNIGTSERKISMIVGRDSKKIRDKSYTSVVFFT